MNDNGTTQVEKDALLGQMSDPVPQYNLSNHIKNVQVTDSVPLGTLRSDINLKIAKVYELIGHATVMRRVLKFAPSWLVSDAYKEEERNWMAYTNPWGKKKYQGMPT